MSPDPDKSLDEESEAFSLILGFPEPGEAPKEVSQCQNRQNEDTWQSHAVFLNIFLCFFIFYYC